MLALSSPRPDLVERVMAALEMDKAVLLTGPSGVGKSAVLWDAAFCIPRGALVSSESSTRRLTCHM